VASADDRQGRIRLAPEHPDRRGFLRRAAALGGSAVAAAASARADDGLTKNLPPRVPEWSRTLGAPILASPYGVSSKYEVNVKRRESPGLTRTPQSSVAFTPLQSLFGIITPSGLHFERHHAGVPDVDPHQHRLMIHGRVREPRLYAMDDLVRFPSVSRVHFIECGANTGMEWANVAVPTVQYSHGMLSCSEWTGVPLAALLDEVGVDRKQAKFVLAEGADGASLTRTVPIEMAQDDVLVCYGQNGEMLRPEQGYPLRLLVPGVQGVSSVKWLRRIEVGHAPWYTREETLHSRRSPARGQASPIHVDPGGEERHHVPFRRPGAARSRLSRDHGSRLVGTRQGAARRYFHRRRPQLAYGEAAGARAGQGVDALSQRLVLGRRPCAPAVARHRRHRLRAAHDPAASRCPRHALDLSQQRDPDLARGYDR
jgi:DMSO/TMAO reductase YedYZ molybdopterin-dependent catalytic subunit